MGERYAWKILLINFDTGVLRNTSVEIPTFTFTEYPPSMKAMGGPLFRYFEIELISSKTDENGYFFYAFTVKYGKH